MERFRLPIGVDNFEKLRHEHLYYADKTGLIQELFSNFSEVTLFTRPRRFGKSLNMSMLRYFLEIGTDKAIFKDLAISRDTAICEQHMGKYPVIFLSLKGVEGRTYDDAVEQLWFVLTEEAARHEILASSESLTHTDKAAFHELSVGKGNLQSSLKLLSRLLFKHYRQKVVILIDEYDVPLEKAQQRGYYDDMILLLRQLFHTALKTNDSLQFAVLTGCLRISKESIFTGLNNMNVNTIVNAQFDEWFGFTEQDVLTVLQYYGLDQYYNITKEWYNGYHFGQTSVYCPWDVINWCNYLMHEPHPRPQNFWVNTSSNNLITQFAELADDTTKNEISFLLEGHTISKPLQLDLTYSDIDRSIDNIWSVLFMTGYLTYRGIEPNGNYLLTIPNHEIAGIIRKKVDEWFTRKVLDDTNGLHDLLSAFDRENAEEIENCLIGYMMDSISYLDGGRTEDKETFYHGLMLGMLKSRKDWIVKSNREGEKGRPDIVVYPKKLTYAIIIEVKYSRDEQELEHTAISALNQIDQKQYDEYFGHRKPSKITHYGIAFCKKDCRVVMNHNHSEPVS